MHNHGYGDNPGTGDIRNETCKEQRKELQKLFTETYKAIQNLKKDADNRAKDPMCNDAAESKKMAELTPLTMQREKTSTKIQEASQAISNLEPVLAMAKNRVKMMEEHINTVLKPECSDVAEVSNMLKSIRDLIESVEKCPGRKNFHLKIPKMPNAESTTVAASSTTVTTSTTTSVGTAGKVKLTSTTTPPVPLDDYGVFDNNAEADAENT